MKKSLRKGVAAVLAVGVFGGCTPNSAPAPHTTPETPPTTSTPKKYDCVESAPHINALTKDFPSLARTVAYAIEDCYKKAPADHVGVKKTEGRISVRTDTKTGQTILFSATSGMGKFDPEGVTEFQATLFETDTSSKPIVSASASKKFSGSWLTSWQSGYKSDKTGYVPTERVNIELTPDAQMVINREPNPVPMELVNKSSVVELVGVQTMGRVLELMRVGQHQDKTSQQTASPFPG